MFCVVDFEEDNAVEAVPSNWVCQDNQTCLWPRKKPENFLEIIQDPVFVPPKAWKAWKVKIVKCYDDYSTANRKATKYVKSSNVETTDEDIRKPKRRRLTKKSPQDPTFSVPNSSIHLGVPALNSENGGGTTFNQLHQSSTADQVSGINNATIPGRVHEQPISTPSLISNEVLLSSLKSVPVTTEENCIFQYNIPTYIGNVIPRSEVSPATTPTSRYPHRVYPRSSQVKFGSEFLPLSDEQPEPFFNYSTPGLNESPNVADISRKLQVLSEEFKKFQEESFVKQEELKAEIKELKALLIRVLAATGGETNTCEALRKLPIKNEEDFRALEVDLTSTSNYQQIVTYLSRIGGDTLPKNVYNVMRCAIGKELSQNLRYTPNSGKTAFGNSKLAKAVRDAVLKTPGVKEVTEDAINTFIGRWFRNSVNTRKDGGFKKNKEKKDTQSSADVLGPDSKDNCPTNDSDSDD